MVWEWNVCGKTSSLIIYTTVGALSAKNCPKHLTGFLGARSSLDTKHGLTCSTPTSCQSATFVRPLFVFVLCFFTIKNHLKKYKCDESVSIKCAARTMIPTLYCRLIARWRHGFLLSFNPWTHGRQSCCSAS